MKTVNISLSLSLTVSEKKNVNVNVINVLLFIYLKETPLMVHLSRALLYWSDDIIFLNKNTSYSCRGKWNWKVEELDLLEVLFHGVFRN